MKRAARTPGACAARTSFCPLNLARSAGNSPHVIPLAGSVTSHRSPADEPTDGQPPSRVCFACRSVIGTVDGQEDATAHGSSDPRLPRESAMDAE